MATIKTPQEIEILRQGGKILAEVLQDVGKKAAVGIELRALDECAMEQIKEKGGEPSFLNYQNSPKLPKFPSAICASVNYEVVHALGNRTYRLKDGDIISIDIGLKYQGLFTDAAFTIGIGKISREAKKLISVTRNSLLAGIEMLYPGNSLYNYSKKVQAYVEKNGFSVVRNLVGHGVGNKVHEPPSIPNFFDKKFPEVILQPGMVIAIEPMVTAGSWEIEILDDGWTVVTEDRSLAAHFEHTVAITEDGCEVLTE